MIKLLISAVFSLGLLLVIPMATQDSSGRAYLQLDREILLYPSTYTSAYQRLLKRIGTFWKPEVEQETVWAWQDFAGNMYFTNGSAEKPNPKALLMTVETTQTGLYAINLTWVYVTMLILWGGCFVLFNFVFEKVFAIRENTDIVQAEKIKQQPKKFQSSQSSPYAILGVSQEDSLEQIKKAYKKKISQYHPDKVEQMAPEFKQIAKQKSVELNRAFEIIQKEKNPTWKTAS